MTKTAAKAEETKKEVVLPPEDTYEMEIIDVQERTGTVYQSTETKQEYVIKAALLGTENPEREDEPFVTFIFINKPNKFYKSNLFKVLASMGIGFTTTDDLDEKGIEFDAIDFLALKGGYLRGIVGPKTTTKGTQVLECKPARLLAVKNKNHLSSNKDILVDLFKGAVPEEF